MAGINTESTPIAGNGNAFVQREYDPAFAMYLYEKHFIDVLSDIGENSLEGDTVTIDKNVSLNPEHSEPEELSFDKTGDMLGLSLHMQHLHTARNLIRGVSQKYLDAQNRALNKNYGK